MFEYSAPPEPQSLLGYVREYAVSLAWAVAHFMRVRLVDRIDVLQVIQPPDVYFPLAWLHKLLGTAIVVDRRDPAMARAPVPAGR